MEGLEWYFSGLLSVFENGSTGQWSVETYFVIFICTFITLIILPYLLWNNRRQSEKFVKSIEDIKDSFDNFGGRKYYLGFTHEPTVARILGLSLNPFSIDAAPGPNGGTSSTHIRVNVRNAKKLFFNVTYHHKAYLFMTKKRNFKFYKEKLKIDNQCDMEKVISSKEIIDYIKKIDFRNSPAFQLSLQNDNLILHFDRTSRDMEFWRTHVEFLNQLANRIEDK